LDSFVLKRQEQVPNEKELSYRWRERVWIEVNVFSKYNARHQSGQRLAAAIG
jgi:hypothetical protein